MDAERWGQVKEVLYEALETPTIERAAFLERVCGGDISLQTEVESLLDPEEEVERFIESPVVPRPKDEPEDALPEDRRVGPYELVECLGRGGMGVVYLATRADQEFDHKVAIKVVKRGMDTDEIIRRFRYERQILAHLDHPNIARLFDGGTTSEGLPYFVMEHVEGEPIQRYCEYHDLNVTQRLQLFLDVCDAVHFAHQNLVVHRDLKPANILVTSQGKVKLLDFGIARLLEADGSLPLTQQATGGMLLTPEYASPEQLRRRPVTTVSDVYSLGVLLFELLTGQRPFDEESTGDFLLDATRTRDPEKPSSAVRRKTGPREPGHEVDRQLVRRLTGDLDFIALKALRQEPRDRYASVRELGEDIERHLTGYPVLARQGAHLYIVSRYLQRHWPALSVAAGVAILLGGLAISVNQNQQAEASAAAEWQRAESELVRADAIEKLLRSIFVGANPQSFREKPMTLLEAIDQGAEAVKDNLNVDPGARSALLNALGFVYEKLDNWDKAQLMLEESLTLRQEVYGEDHPLVGEAFNNLGMALRYQGKYDQAEEAYHRAIEIGRQLDKDPMRLAVYLNNLAGLHRIYKGELREAIKFYNQSLALKKKHLGENIVHDDIAKSLNNLGNVWLALGEYDEAEGLFQQALDIRQELGLSDAISTSLLSLGVLYRDRGQLEEAESYLERSLDLRRKVYKETDHSRLASVLASMGVCLQLQGRWTQAAQYYQQALEMQGRLWPDGHRDTAITLREMAQLAVSQGDALRADGLARKALDIAERVVEPGHWLLPDIRAVLGGVLVAQGNYEEAGGILRSAYSDLVAVRGAQARQSREAEAHLAVLEQALEDAGISAGGTAVQPPRPQG